MSLASAFNLTSGAMAGLSPQAHHCNLKSEDK
jgi:hypothetical protein